MRQAFCGIVAGTDPKYLLPANFYDQTDPKNKNVLNRVQNYCGEAGYTLPSIPKIIVAQAGDLADAAWRLQRPINYATEDNRKLFCAAVQARGANALYKTELQTGRNAQWVDAPQTPDGTLKFSQLCPDVPYK